ncbi:hybrid sensor histidine kinase/response regulator transcription factor [Flavobacterium yafengii]|uniref:hybrid sensor histidine kinase/response regulator transcription factor n=1 Tax=Flavobacterium yafengii TaxID=3041253 RepID=UPI0024A99EEF|nr:hybrid sensor histidine kinase/response regulator transcription factor [Flavobacterium yafengii]MDI5898568.1 two-component regulator propeller domain-containing protein [Flavobacterium yafengii]
MKKFFFVCYLVLFSITIWSQKPIEKYRFVNIKESISQIGVPTIIQDHYGFIWLGTSGAGLNKFDGSDYKTYKFKPNDPTSLSNNTLTCSYLDNKNRLWFGTDEGLNLYDYKNDCFKRILLSEFKKNQKNVLVKSLIGDNKGNLFIGTLELGLFKLNLNNFKVEKIPCQESNLTSTITINALQVDSKGKVYAGTDRGLKEFDPKTNSLRRSVFKNIEGVKSINEPVHCLLIEKNTIWLGTVSTGLFKIKRNDNSKDHLFEIKHFQFSQNRILSIASLPDKTVMCGTENEGLFHIDDNGEILNHYLSSKSERNNILSNSIWSLFVDRNERIWMGYYNAGIGVYDKLYDKFENLESIPGIANSLQISSVTAIVKDRFNRFWIAMDGGGIDVFDAKSRQYTHIGSTENKVYSGLTDNYVEALLIDSKQNIWAGTWNGGVYFLKNGDKKFINFTVKNTGGGLTSNNVISITEDLEGTIWLASRDKGLHSFNPDTGKFINYRSGAFLKYGISESYVSKVLVDKKGDLWVATTNIGLFKIKKLAGNTFSIVSLANRMSKEFKNYAKTNVVLSLYEGEDGSIWIGTKGAGLCKYSGKTDSFKWYNKRNGLDADNIVGIIGDLKGNIWLSSNSGVARLDVKTNTFTKFTKNDGLLSNDFNRNATFRDEQGIIYFGNYFGLDYFNPSNIKVNNILPSLYLTGFKLFNKTVTTNQKGSPLQSVIGETKSITLDNTQSVFTIEYTGINYTRPEKNQYAYYLEGLEKSWNYVGRLKSATYTNLEQGNYIFKLKSANSDGKWNKEILELKITVLPPWWKSNIALFSYVVFLLLGGYYFNKIMVSRLNKNKGIILEQNKRVQEKALNEKKFQFFTNISHELRTPLTLIMNSIDDIIRDDTLNLATRTKEKLNIIHKNTNRLYRLINELLDFKKLESNKLKVKAVKVNLVDFIKEVVIHFREELSIKGIEFDLDSDVADLTIWSDADMLEKIIFNILSNAIKVTPNGGTININLQSTDKLFHLPLVNKTEGVKAVEIIISDTGPGIEKGELEKIFERFYQVENLNKSYYGGTGIGLELVRDFVRLHKGEIEVDSKVGEGTTFTIILPMGKSHFDDNEILLNSIEVQVKKEQALTSFEKEKEKEIDIDETLHRYTLLIVEDNYELRDYLKKELENEYKVLVVSNGKSGIDLANEFLPDIILTDVMMPEMDGFDFCKNIKRDLRTSHIPVLMLTAKTEIEDRIEGIEVGADAYMVKPFDMRLLRLRLSQLITSRQLIFNKYFSLISEVPEGIKTLSLDKEFIEKVLNYIKENISNPDLNVESLATQLKLSRSQFYRKIKVLTNQTANEFLRNVRLQKAKQILEMDNVSISEVSYKTGFSSPSYFTKCFKSYFGILPTDVKIKKNEL